MIYRVHSDPVTADLRDAILRRDRECVLAKIEPDHLCKDAWGHPHAANDVSRLTIEHVHDVGGMMGKRAKSDLHHCLALCYAANVKPPTKSERAAFRVYLAAIQP